MVDASAGVPHLHRGIPPSVRYCTPGTIPPMTGSKVELDADLAALAEAKAVANGERLEDVIERMVLAYLEDS